MFVGRKNELDTLNKLYNKDNFQMIIMYGRRRVGKTTLITKFLEDKKSIFFVAQEANDKLNLEIFSKQIYSYLNMSLTLPKFNTWIDAFDFIAEKAIEQRIILVMDEFPYAAESNKSLMSIMQNTIDHKLKYTNIFIILCGSLMTFMEHDVMGYKSPLYGRRTAQMKIQTFDYYDASKMLSEYSYEDKIKFYCVLGGIPHYLAQVNRKEDFNNNIQELMFNISGYLYDEPMMLLQQELREPAMYNSIIKAISTGASKLNEIATKIGEDRTKCIKYLQKLLQLGILYKEYPFGDNVLKSRKGIYKITDNYYNFWYCYVFTNKNIIEQGNADIIFNNIVLSNLSNYIGNVFEVICQQYLIRANKNKMLPFIFTEIGRWWGNNSIDKRQEEIDIVAASKIENNVIFAECKYRNELTDEKVLNKLRRKSELIKGYDEKYFMLFSKSGFTHELKNMAENSQNIILIDLEMIFDF